MHCRVYPVVNPYHLQGLLRMADHRPRLTMVNLHLHPHLQLL